MGDGASARYDTTHRERCNFLGVGESEEGVGSTFKVILPSDPEQVLADA